MTTKIRLTCHARERAAQRLSRQADLDLFLKYAGQGYHGLVMTRESVDRANRDAIEARKLADRARRLLGVHLPTGDDGSAITLERLNRRKSKRLLSNDLFL